MRVLLLAVLGMLSAAHAAQAAAPEVEACRTFGERELQKAGLDIRALVIDTDAHLHLHRSGTKIGTQPVSSVLSGNGSIVRSVGPAVELVFVCPLGSDARALWFHWLPRPEAPALAQCRRAPGAADCLRLLLDLADRDLVEGAAPVFQDSVDADARAGNENASDAYRSAAAAWREYRDRECARRGAKDSEEWLGCQVDLTRRRLLDMR